jgi:hypothetical protein
MESGSLHQPNDKLFRSTFSELETAAAFFREYVPSGVLGSGVDWSTLREEAGSFVDEELAGSESDLLFCVRSGEGEAWVYVLFEHQSREDPWMALRLLRYMVRIWEKQRSGGMAPGAGEGGAAVRLWPIVPVVLAQGKTGWKTGCRFGEFFGGIDGGVRERVPDFEYVRVELALLGYGEMRGSAEGILAMRVLRAEAFGELLEALVWDEELLLRVGSGMLERWLRFIANEDIDKELFRRRAQALRNPKLRRKTMTLAEQWEQEGLIKGRRQGQIEMAQRSVVDALEARFGSVPAGLIEAVLGETRLEKLRGLLVDAIRCESLEGFAQKLGR